MSSDLFKLISPVVYVIFVLSYFCSARSVKLVGPSLFFASFVAFSQNFSFVYREVHQLIQICLIVLYVNEFLRKFIVLKINFIFLILLFFVLFSFIFSVFDEDARAQLINLISVIFVVNYLFAKVVSAEVMRELMSFVAKLAVVASFVGLFEYFLNVSPRIEGTFSNPNYFAFFLGIGWCFAFEVMSGLRRKLSLCIIFMVIILSGSRVAIVFPFVHVLWSAYRCNGFRRLVTYGLVVLIFSSAILVSGASRFSNAEASEGSDAERVIFALIAYKMASDHPFTGVGWGRFAPEFSSYSSTVESIVVSAGEVNVSSQDRRVTHNDYMRILAELGWVAFFMTLFLLFTCFVRIIRYTTNEYNYIMPVWLGVVAFSMTHNNLNGAVFWFIFLLPLKFLKRKSFDI
jgi:O-antigen ligase